MSPSLEDLKVILSALPVDQRAELAQYLLHSLDPKEESAEIEWLELAEQRMAEVHSGGVVGIPADEVLKGLAGPGQ